MYVLGLCGARQVKGGCLAKKCTSGHKKGATACQFDAQSQAIQMISKLPQELTTAANNQLDI